MVLPGPGPPAGRPVKPSDSPFVVLQLWHWQGAKWLRIPLLRAEGFQADMVPIHFHPDEAVLIGCLHLAPSWIFEAHDCIRGVDIGGTNIRCGRVETRRKNALDLSKASVRKSELWRPEIAGHAPRS